MFGSTAGDRPMVMWKCSSTHQTLRIRTPMIRTNTTPVYQHSKLPGGRRALLLAARPLTTSGCSADKASFDLDDQHVISTTSGVTWVIQSFPNQKEPGLKTNVSPQNQKKTAETLKEFPLSALQPWPGQ